MQQMDTGEPSSMDHSAPRRKKGRKRQKKSANEPIANKAREENVVNVPTSSCVWRICTSGEPMLPQHMLYALNIEI